MSWKDILKAMSQNDLQQLINRAKTQADNYNQLYELTKDLAYDIDDTENTQQVLSEIREVWERITKTGLEENIDMHLSKLQEIIRGV
tara:strand:+ start:1358 stop:1618 length:261 start_codon:yes stop_codon:yes gene_type:complete